MGVPLGRKEIRNIGIRGVIRPAEVDDHLIPEGAVTEVQNFNFDRKGTASTRPGLTRVATTVTTTDVYTSFGLHNSQSSTMMVVFSGAGSSRIYVFDGTWTAPAGVDLTGGTASVPIRFVDFGSYTIVLNFIANTLSSMYVFPARVESGSYWTATHRTAINPQNMWGYNPTFGEVFKSRVYVSGDSNYPSRLFFSSVISIAGVITWSPTTDYVDINPGDGETNTGLKRFSTELLFFKPNYIYRFRTAGVDPDPWIKIGTRSQESIVEGKNGIYFHHDSGIYRYQGNYPTEISRPVIDFIKAIPFSQYSKIAGWKDDDHIYWSIGNVTIAETYGNITWNNVVLRYTESADLWTIYSYPSRIQRGMTFVTGTTKSIVVSTDNGVVAEFNQGTTDLLEPIKYRLVTKWYEFEGIENRKSIERLCTVCEKARDAHIMVQVDNKQDWQELGQLTKYLNYFGPFAIKHHRVRFKITGVSQGEYMIFQGLIITHGQNEGFIDKDK